MRRHALVLLCVLASTAAALPQDYGLLRSRTDSGERWAPFHALKTQAPDLAKAFAPHVHVNQKGERMPYRLFTPARIEPGRAYPLVVFLHGASGSGTDNAKQLEGGNRYGALVWALPGNQARHPAFVLAPQSDWNWPCIIFDPKNPPKIAADIKLCPPDALGLGARLAFEVIDSLLGTLPIDRSRIYVTGHSMGGAGTWHMIAHRPRFFAAAVPVCGRGHPETASIFKDVPIWNFHGARDDVEPVASSRVMVDALRKAGGRPRHTEYPDLGHNVFAWAYTEPALVEWLFAQRRTGAIPRATTSTTGMARPRVSPENRSRPLDEPPHRDTFSYPSRARISSTSSTAWSVAYFVRSASRSRADRQRSTPRGS